MWVFDPAWESWSASSYKPGQSTRLGMQCKFQNACLQDLSKEISKGRFLSKVGDSLILFGVSSNGEKKSKTDL